MSPRVRSTLVLLGTLVLGIVLGALALGALSHHRHDRVHDLHHRHGFTSYLMDAIEPRDEAQRRAIEPHVERAADAARAELMATHERLMTRMTALQDSLRTILDEAQMERLQSALHMAGRHGARVPGFREHRERHEHPEEP